MPTFDLLTPAAASPKIRKEEKVATDYATAILYMAPHTAAGRGNVCTSASAECMAACLGLYSGRADIIKRGEKSNAVRDARIRRTQAFFDLGAEAFTASLSRDIGKHIAWCGERGKLPAIRPNGASDLKWERIAPVMFDVFHDVMFYDYTKHPVASRPNLPANYHLTQSYSGHNVADCMDALAIGRNVAVVFRCSPSEALPPFLNIGGVDVPVVDGDVTDQRFRDPVGVIVGLRAKGRLRKRPTVFTVDPADPVIRI